VRILRRAGARATFFLVGRELTYWPQIPRLERSVAALGDHTWSHPDLRLLAKSAMASELSRTKAAIARTAGTEVELFRPPYDLSDPAIIATARSLGMAETLWSIDSRDSEGANWSRIAAIVSRSVRPGSIVLMHENRGQTLRALRFRILPELRRRHFELVSVPELMATDPPSLAQLRGGIRACSARSLLSSR
jgi:peptidoglycan/xylan/chitin deacetylase (PgdA/CDA1 family)